VTVNMTLWIVTSILSLTFLASGAVKLARPRQTLVRSGYAWAEDFSDSAVWWIGMCEVLGALGLLLPGLLGVVPALVPAAAAGLTVLMAAAMVTHLRRGEARQAAVPIVLAAVAFLVAIMRFGAYAL
jgi:uncharacterized membrane protein